MSWGDTMKVGFMNTSCLMNAVKWAYTIMISELRRSKGSFMVLFIWGNLNLALLPTSDLRLSFIGDDGRTERLSTLSKDSQCSDVAIEEIPVDKSGRSFLLKISDGEVLYYWCSEKSKLLGIELLSKIKDFVKRKPSLAELTGISESRLRCFATHLRAYLVGSTVTTRASAVASLASSPDTLDSELCQTVQSSSASLTSLLSQHYNSQVAKTSLLCQGGPSASSSSFKEGQPRNLSLRSVDIGKLRQLGDIQLSCVDNPAVGLPSMMDESSSNHSERGMFAEAAESCLFSPLSLLESLGKSAVPPLLRPASQVPSIGASRLSPYYCWCPPVASTLQCTVVPPQLPFSATESPSFLPPLSSLLPDTGCSSALKPMSPLNLSDLPCMDFPPFLPEPLVRLPLSRPISQHIPIFTPLVCDPIVHIPVIDVCSSGQGYLVSAAPAISTAISPLHPKLMNPLIPETDSVVDKGARETLRLLISSSSQTIPPLMDVFPSVLTSTNEKPSIFVTGSRGLYSGTRDVDAISNSIAAMGLVTLSEGSIGGAVVKRCINQGNLVDHLEKPGGPGGTCSDDDASIFTNLRKERTD
ncbi:uncharacterized protein LOC132312140 isoform X2 [Cornus florida]|uniref:uncharacterized protein LOC132312140 isoform X2 n=1 Tax=Cornus florida TaxID=4283 RepID=UPI00289F1CD6|nr:uncharacterized protein LOC132312140 isoform X2 [Cornus florida]